MKESESFPQDTFASFKLQATKSAALLKAQGKEDTYGSEG